MSATLTATATPHRHPVQPIPLPLSVQILSTLIFGAFAITATALAFVHFWPAGLALAVVLGWRGGFAPQAGPGIDPAEFVAELRNLGPEAAERARRPSGNASFDAYRADTLRRLEEEQDSFEMFLDRLRSARDKTEFDSFMEDRAARRPPSEDTPA